MHPEGRSAVAEARALWLPGFDTPIEAARPAVLARALYALLALDLWTDMVPHAGRYGVDGFNVAHFAWLDALLPVPSSAAYCALLAGTGVVAASCALGPTRAGLRWCVALAYTLAWAMSMHDSYQHHYLLSWLLLGLAAAPVSPNLPEQARVRAPGYVFVCLTCASVYTFTALSKLAPAWRDGSVLRSLSHAQPPGHPHPGPLDAARDAAAAIGIPDAQFFAGLALATAALQVLIASGYLAALFAQRASPRAPLRAVCDAALAGAIVFHLGAELSGVFRIGWFSHYMILVAAVCLGPRRGVAAANRALARAGVRLSAVARAPLPLHGVALVLVWSGASLVVARGHVPGLAGGAAAGGLVVLLAGFQGRRRPRVLAACAGSALLLAGSITLRPVAFDYHRRLAGELLRLGRRADALDAYREAERVAPPGQSRRGKIRALEASERGASPPPERP